MSASLWDLPSVLRARRPCAVRARQCRIVITIATPVRGTFTTRIGTSRRLVRFRVLRCMCTVRQPRGIVIRSGISLRTVSKTRELNVRNQPVRADSLFYSMGMWCYTSSASSPCSWRWA